MEHSEVQECAGHGSNTEKLSNGEGITEEKCAAKTKKLSEGLDKSTISEPANLEKMSGLIKQGAPVLKESKSKSEVYDTSNKLHLEDKNHNKENENNLSNDAPKENVQEDCNLREKGKEENTSENTSILQNGTEASGIGIVAENSEKENQENIEEQKYDTVNEKNETAIKPNNGQENPNLHEVSDEIRETEKSVFKTETEASSMNTVVANSEKVKQRFDAIKPKYAQGNADEIGETEKSALKSEIETSSNDTDTGTSRKEEKEKIQNKTSRKENTEHTSNDSLKVISTQENPNSEEDLFEIQQFTIKTEMGTSTIDKVQNLQYHNSCMDSDELNSDDQSITESPGARESVGLGHRTLNGEAYGFEEKTWKEPIRFHPVHGENIKLSEDGFIASRQECANFFSQGIAFSSRSIGIEEKICIRFEEISNYWLSFFTFGLTNNDPATLAGDLPGIAITDLANKPGYWLAPLPKTFCKKGSIFYYYITDSGSVDYGINGILKGTMIWDVDTSKPIWAFIDIFGYYTAVKFVNPRTPIQARRSSSFEEKKYLTGTNQLVSSLPRLKYQSPTIPLAPLNLHATKGQNVQFMKFKSVVTKSDDVFNQGYLFTQRPMYSGQMIVIQIISTGPGYEYLPVGIIKQDPSSLNPQDLPNNAEDLAKCGDNWEVFKNVANFLQYGDELAIMRTSDGEVQLKRNDEELVTVTRVDKKLKFWLFVEIYGAIKIVKLWTTYCKRLCPCKRGIPKKI